MGNIKENSLKNINNLSFLVSYITRKGWGGAIIDHRNNTVYTNIVGFFIGTKGRNIKQYKDNFPGIKIRSFEDLGARRSNSWEFTYLCEKRDHPGPASSVRSGPKGGTEVWIFPEWVKEGLDSGDIEAKGMEKVEKPPFYDETKKNGNLQYHIENERS